MLNGRAEPAIAASRGGAACSRRGERRVFSPEVSELHHSAIMDASFLGRAIVLWCAIIPLAVFNGILREKVLARWMRPEAARRLSGLSLSALVLLFAVATVTWVPASGCAEYWMVGVLWLVLTVAFEFLFGRFVGKKSYAELIGAYCFRDGDIWPVVLGVVVIAPVAAAWMRDLC